MKMGKERTEEGGRAHSLGNEGRKERRERRKESWKMGRRKRREGRRDCLRICMDEERRIRERKGGRDGEGNDRKREEERKGRNMRKRSGKLKE